MVKVEYVTKEQLESGIREAIKESGAPDLKVLMKRFHLYGDWVAYSVLSDIDSKLWMMELPRVPTCCMGEDHDREDGEILWPGEPGAAPNFKAAE